MIMIKNSKFCVTMVLNFISIESVLMTLQFLVKKSIKQQY